MVQFVFHFECAFSTTNQAATVASDLAKRMFHFDQSGDRIIDNYCFDWLNENRFKDRTILVVGLLTCIFQIEFIRHSSYVQNQYCINMTSADKTEKHESAMIKERKVSKTLKTFGGMMGGAVEACTLQPLDTGMEYIGSIPRCQSISNFS